MSALITSIASGRSRACNARCYNATRRELSSHVVEPVLVETQSHNLVVSSALGNTLGRVVGIVKNQHG